MAVPATELRPRTAVALFDAAIRLCARSSGVWALTLPGGVAVLWALLRMVDALSRGADVLGPSLLFTAAWFFRGLCQGAACHYLDQQLLAPEPPTTWGAFKAALARLPSLSITVAFIAVVNAVSLPFSFGLAFIFMPALTVAYAVTMKGQGHPLALYGTCARMLGSAKRIAAAVRVLFAVFLLVALNLHIAANTLIYLGRKLAGLELTYAQRFASMDNAEWVTIVIALAFVLFEPLRAAVATLLLLDGRVREEGLDLLAAVEQLPKRRRRNEPLRRARDIAAALALAVGASLLPVDGWAQTEGGAPLERLRGAAAECGYESHTLEHELNGADRLPPAEHAALRRLADEAEMYAWDWEDCDTLQQRLDTALPLVREAVASTGAPTATASDRAKEILGRSEFATAPPRPVEVEDEDGSSSWLRETWLKFLAWLLKPSEREVRPHSPDPLPNLGMGAAGAVVIVLVAAMVLLLIVVLVRSLRTQAQDRPELEVLAEAAPGTGTGEQSALARPPEGWASLADDLAAAGNFREAVRHLYLALLSRLHRAGAIDYDPTLSNWDYCRGFRGRREWLPTFRELTLRFDFAWYGSTDVGQDGYLAFRRLSQPILAPDPGSPNA